MTLEHYFAMGKGDFVMVYGVIDGKTHHLRTFEDGAVASHFMDLCEEYLCGFYYEEVFDAINQAVMP